MSEGLFQFHGAQVSCIQTHRSQWTCRNTTQASDHQKQVMAYNSKREVLAISFSVDHDPRVMHT